MSEKRLGKLMKGSTLASQILDSAREKIATIRQKTGVTPCLATVLVGDDESSAVYVRMKRKRCDDVGMTSLLVKLPRETTTETLVAEVTKLANDASVHGILIQHPVPRSVDKRAAFETIPLLKDVDGVTSEAMGRLILGMPAFPACTPAGIMRLLIDHNVEFDGAHAVVIGRSPIIGRPMASMLINVHATVTLCHSRTRDLPDIVRQADILIAAVGQSRFVQGDWIKEGAIVVDAGYNVGNVGDVDFEAAMERAGMITPVPGGVGPMTIATLIEQTADAAVEQLGISL
jgi:methylenetetrahydrofolate dehydrogenase (NADP+) / methenyltetrahydrofolate cyclohydrolase